MARRHGIVLLGSTGSIGLSTLDVVRRLNGRFHIHALAANRNVERLLAQVREFRPRLVVVGDGEPRRRLGAALKGMKNPPRLMSGRVGLEAAASVPAAETVVCGIVGFEGLFPLIAALRARKRVALANKEALIVAGPLVMAAARRHRATLIPVDSEHSAIYQCLAGQPGSAVRRIVLTASGGPFYRTRGNLDTVGVERALAHPTWKMGEKITVDSATLMNKGLEAIEAHTLFDVPMERIQIVIHPQSIVHSLVEFEDGSMLAQLSKPDMRLPIQYALTHPERIASPVSRLRLEDVGRLDFRRPDFSRFPCLGLALRAGARGGSAPAVLSAANEEAVRAFIGRRLSFSGIPAVVGRVLRRHRVRSRPSLENVVALDAWARHTAGHLIDTTRTVSP